MIKKLPIIPGTGARLKKKNLTDLGPSDNCLSLTEAPEHEEDAEMDGNTRAHLEHIRETVNSSLNYHSTQMHNGGD